MRLIDNNLKLRAILLGSAFIVVLNACAPKGFVSPSKSDPSVATSVNSGTTVEIDALKPRSTSNDNTAPNAVELLWQIPTQPVDGFVIKLGYSRDHLDKELRVTTSALERFEDPKHGYVYRYVLSDIPRTHPLYVTIAARRGDAVSAPSEIFELQALTDIIE